MKFYRGFNFSHNQALFRVVMACLIAVLLTHAPASSAHHSFADYDFDTQIEFNGVVATLSFKNPHIGMTLAVEDEQGEEAIIVFSDGAPANMLARSGLKPDMLKPGTAVRVVGSPSRTIPGKYFIRKIILSDGSEF